MSARMVKRVLRDSQVAPLADVPLADRAIEDEEEEEQPAQVVRNRFDLLCLQDDEDEVEGVELHEDTSQISTAERFPEPSSSKGRKKKKGKKKSKVSATQKEVQAAISAEDTVLEESAGTANVAKGDSSARKHTRVLSGRKSAQILAVDSKFLRAEDELRRIFGSKVINSVERRGDGGGAMGNWQRRPLVRRGARGLRKTMLTMPSEHWPRGGLSMECTEVKDGLQFFRYTYSASYVETQKQFEACVSSHDPNSIVMLLAHHPYHIDSLLAMAELHRQMGQHQQAAQYLERCLFALESAWHPLFDPTLGTCRLDFSHNANRPLFVALFKHMQHLGRRGCHRTALEVCKLLLSLDADDPLGALFCIDYFALRAEQYEWLERFAEEYSTDKPLSLFPSFSLSLAVARFRIEEKEQSLQEPASSRPENSAGKESGKNSSSDLLKQALMLHPTMLVRLVEKAPIKEDLSWAKITKHPFFNRPSVGGPSLEHLISIYLERNYLLWRAAEVQGWLKDAASAVLQAVDAKNGGEAATWACVREETFQTSDNEYSHLLVSDFSDTAATLPPEELQQMGIQVGHAMGNNDVHPAPEAGEAVEVPDIEGGHGILAFLQSLLPWIDPWADYFPDSQQEDPHENVEGSSDD